MNLTGDFNNWNVNCDEMNALKDGLFSDTDLESGREYQFRYLLDGTTWINDEEADGYRNSGLTPEIRCFLSDFFGIYPIFYC